MTVEFDPAKNGINRDKHGIDLSLAAEFEFETALEKVDDRREYGEIRYQAMGYIAGRLHLMVYTMRGDVVRVISLRKANQREIEEYEAS